MKHANVAVFVPHQGCPNQCSFCDQHSISGAQAVPTPEEVAAQLKDALVQLGQRAQHAQIAFFGGSFTAIPRHTMVALLESAAPFLGEKGFSSIRVSTRPDAVDAEVLQLLKSYGVSAIELGAQSMCDEVLRLNQRGHTALQVQQAAEQIKAAGFSLGLQMMTGLYGDTPAGSHRTAQLLAELEPDTMRIYPTVVLQNTHLAELFRQGAYTPLGVEDSVELCAELLEFFQQRSIAVIRVGLHPEPSMQARMLAGGFHPAFRELCEGRLMLKKALQQLEHIPAGAVELVVAPSCVSRMAGQRRCNVLALEQMGYRVKIKTEPDMPLLAVRMQVPVQR